MTHFRADRREGRYVRVLRRLQRLPARGIGERRQTRYEPTASALAWRRQQKLVSACHAPITLLGAALVAALATLVEHIIRNDGDTGSSPVSGTSPPPENGDRKSTRLNSSH